MKGIIYRITNKVNGKSYIGQTRYTLEFRWRQHQHKSDNTYFHNAIRKYGKDNFTIEILEECNISDLDSKEIFYIAKYDTFNNGYNLTIGGSGNRTLLLDDKYDEIESLYLSGFSSNKIATLFNVDKATVVKILKSLGVKIRSNKLNINRQEFIELVKDYNTGFSLRELAKRYNCSPIGLKQYLVNKGVDLKIKYNILKDTVAQNNIINEYLDNKLTLKELLNKYHCSYNTFTNILSTHGIKQKGKGGKFKLRDNECLEVIRLYNSGTSVKSLSDKFNVDKCTIYSLLRRYKVII